MSHYFYLSQFLQSSKNLLQVQPSDLYFYNKDKSQEFIHFLCYSPSFLWHIFHDSIMQDDKIIIKAVLNFNNASSVHQEHLIYQTKIKLTKIVNIEFPHRLFWRKVNFFSNPCFKLCCYQAGNLHVTFPK